VTNQFPFCVFIFSIPASLTTVRWDESYCSADTEVLWAVVFEWIHCDSCYRKHIGDELSDKQVILYSVTTEVGVLLKLDADDSTSPRQFRRKPS